jgi:hypothetical protein
MKTFTITLANLTSPREICPLLEARKCKYYNYTFQSNFGVIKFGKAADNEWMAGTWGNRLYRQAGGINGWGSYALHDTSANKMREQMNIHFPTLTRNDVTITVYDYTDELVGLDEKEIDRRLLNEEHELIKKHVEDYGDTPKLNIQCTKIRTKAMFDDFFEVEYD